MSKNRDLIYDMAEAPETENFEQLDSEPLQLGGVGEDAPAANDRQVTTPGDVHVAPQMPTPIDGTLRQFALRVPDVIDACSGIMVFGKRIKSLVFSTDLSIIRNVNADAVFAVYPFTPQPIITQALLMASDLPVFIGILAAQQYIPQPEPHQAFLGELGLDGTLRPIAGTLPMALAAQKAGVTELFVPAENAAEAAVAEQLALAKQVLAADEAAL